MSVFRPVRHNCDLGLLGIKESCDSCVSVRNYLICFYRPEACHLACFHYLALLASLIVILYVTSK